jgi:multidrug efflux system membrane fusion protein
VYVVQPDSTVQSRDIKIVATEGETTAVTGVKSGEQLVTDGFDKLQSGSKIAVRKPEPAAGATPAAAAAPTPTPAHE